MATWTDAYLDTIINEMGTRDALYRILELLPQEESDRVLQIIWEEIAE